jgi:hypothetical protein
MLSISTGRFIWTFMVGFIVTSQLNWGVAAFFLNDWAMPAFDGFMRTSESGAGQPVNIARMALGFMGPLFVVALLQAMLKTPKGWVARAIFLSAIVSLGAFYGTYTFIAGWGNVNWWPLMVTATCDTVTITAGALLIGYLQTGISKGRRP